MKCRQSRVMSKASILILLVVVGELFLSTFAQVVEQQQNTRDVLNKEKLNGDVEDSLASLQHHHIVKRKSKGGRGFGFGKSKSKSKSQSSTYPKQQSSNPNYGSYPKQPGGNMGPPPAYPGANTRPGGFNQAPPAYPGGGHIPPPAYPGYNNMGGGHPNMGGGYPSMGGGYPSMGGGYPSMGGGYPNMGMGTGMGGAMGAGMLGKSKGGLGRSLGSSGFGTIAAGALGAYGGYKLGKLVGNLGHHGHYGRYDDNGRYIRCEPPPPSAIRVDPETNVTYIPPNANYDLRCSYFDRQPPAYYTSSSHLPGLSFVVLALSIFLSQHLHI